MQQVTVKCKDFSVADTGNDRIIVISGVHNSLTRTIPISGKVLLSLDVEGDSVFESTQALLVTNSSVSNSPLGEDLENIVLTGKPADYSTHINDADTQYLEIARRIRDTGRHSGNRTDTDTIKLFGDAHLKFDLRRGLPLLTTKKVLVESIKKELIWFFRGQTNTKDLGCGIWDQWSTEDGECGPIYGAQWRKWQATHEVHESNQDKIDFLQAKGYHISHRLDQFVIMSKQIDQLKSVVERIKNNPNDRRMIVSAWNPAVEPDSSIKPKENAALGMQSLPPCHTMWQVACTKMTVSERYDEYMSSSAKHQMLKGKSYSEALADEQEKFDCYVEDFTETSGIYDLEDVLNSLNAPKYFLDLKMYQRSADWFIGVPFNIASYAMIQEVLANYTNTVARNFMPTFGDYHIYVNHLEQLATQMIQPHKPMPTCVIKPCLGHKSIEDYQADDICIIGYEPGITLKGEVAE